MIFFSGIIYLFSRGLLLQNETFQRAKDLKTKEISVYTQILHAKTI